MTVGTNTFLADSSLLIRSVLSSGLTDPVAATRSTNSQFILTGNPTRTLEYPSIVIKQGNIKTRRLGVGSINYWAEIPFELSIYGRNQREKDSLTQSTINTLRTTQFTTGTAANQLYNFAINSATDADSFEAGGQSIKRKILSIRYNVILSP